MTISLPLAGRLAGLLAAVLTGVFVITELVGMTSSAQAAQQRPNVVMVVTDDQRLDEMRYMPLTRSLVADQGVTFENFLSTYPVCAPSRATMLSGQYMHSHGVRTLGPPDGGYDAFDFSTGLAVWLQRAGYRTAHIGKPLNGYGVRYDVTPNMLSPVPTPPGYDDWYAAIDPTTYEMFGTLYQDNGVVHPALGAQYQTDALAERAVQDIRKWAPGDKPFFMQVNTSAPHSPAHDGDAGAQPAPRHAGMYSDLPLRRDPSYNEADVSDKPSVVRNWKPLTDADTASITRRERDRVESLQAVDELVGRVVSALDRSGELDNTVIMFTSDNGFFNGEHRWFSEKVDMYEPSIRVPLVVRGPGFPKGASRRQITGNIDLAPTIAALSGATPSRSMDGESLLPYAADSQYRRDRTIAIESSWPETGGLLALLRPRAVGINIFYTGVRTRRYKYVEYTKDVHGMPAHEEQLYDLRRDPNELQSLHADPAYAALKARLQRKLRVLRNCKGTACRQRFATNPKR